MTKIQHMLTLLLCNWIRFQVFRKKSYKTGYSESFARRSTQHLNRMMSCTPLLRNIFWWEHLQTQNLIHNTIWSDWTEVKHYQESDNNASILRCNKTFEATIFLALNFFNESLVHGSWWYDVWRHFNGGVMKFLFIKILRSYTK